MKFFLDSLSLVKWGVLSGILLGISISFTSPFLILKRNALFPHALTHVYFLAIILASIVLNKIPFYFSFPFIAIFTLLFTSLIWILRKRVKFYEDTSTSIVTHLALGIALILATKTYQYDARILSYLFGSLIGITYKEFFESFITFFFTLVIFYKFYPLWIAQITDKELPGLDFKLANLLFLILVTFQIIIGVKLMGILLVSVLFIFSTSFVLQFTKNFKFLILITILLNILGILGGTIISIFWDVPFSGAVVIFMSLYILLSFILSFLK
ncbi:MAG: hypothetical protein DRP34_01245 [Thermodesulfobacteriota bacterium]|nr:metal ABC transporter permease [Thermodesulfobacteriota bacterium]MCU4138347.1 ABC-type Mn2+/Zn2+ transport system [Thermodesulfobacteriota bacterium]RKX63730.1 MAG: hypothetical protein DRP34_01245 [Thermodesulfobacteriota bacterium]